MGFFEKLKIEDEIKVKPKKDWKKLFEKIINYSLILLTIVCVLIIVIILKKIKKN
jgi:hypothetical protein